MKYRRKPIEFEAHQWFKNGDHPQDGEERFPEGHEYAGEKLEGKVVRYFRHPFVDGQEKCQKCGQIMHVHGWIDTLEGGHNVCPGDWIVTGIQGEHWPVKPDVFAATYEPVPDNGPQL